MTRKDEIYPIFLSKISDLIYNIQGLSHYSHCQCNNVPKKFAFYKFRKCHYPPFPYAILLKFQVIIALISEIFRNIRKFYFYRHQFNLI